MSRLRRQDGFTLTELVMAITVGFVVLSATLGLLESSVHLNLGVMSKTDAMQRGRLAMDNVTQQLRSQVCLDYDNPAVVAGGDGNSVTFYSDYTFDGKRPWKRRLTFDSAKRTITALGWEAPQAAALPLTTASFPLNPTQRRVVIDNVLNQRKDNADVPFLRYYAYQVVAGVARPTKPLNTPLTADDAKTVARIEIAFTARPTGSKDDKGAVNLSDEIMARHLDPNVSLNPKCV
jgi:type II secretory pathway pseudopilin PulG